VVALNRAVAVAEVSGPAAALDLVDGLDLGGYYLYHAVRADLLRRLGRDAEAAAAYELAIAQTRNAAERAYLTLAKERPPHPEGVADRQGQAGHDAKAGDEEHMRTAQVEHQEP
jgi:hypothetical protein